MKIKSKGYTLVELLISMAILAAVMVGVISIMRAASVSFKNESIEVKLQEESQILLSQVEELLVDCKEVQGSSTSYDGIYRIKIRDSSVLDSNASNAYKDIYLRWHDYGVYYSEDYFGNNEDLIAEGVDQFIISGIDTTDGDNICIVKVKMYNHAGDTEYRYDATKNIVFRNDVENDPDRDDSFMNNAPAGGGGGANERTLYVGRYQVVDLQQLYGITSVSSYNGTNEYTFINPNSVNSTTGGINTSYNTQTAPSIYFTTSSSTNYALDDQFSADIVGSTGSETLTVHLVTKPCKFQDGCGVIEFPNKSVNDGNNKGFFSYATFDGFCFQDYLKYNSSSSVNASITFNGTTKTGTLKSAYYNNAFGQFSYQYNMGLCYDMFESDKLVVRFNNGHTESSASNLSSGDKDITLTVNLPNGSGTVPYSGTYKAVSSGTNLSNIN